jgi:hypothetical protein
MFMTAVFSFLLLIVPAELGCVADGNPRFIEGSQQICDMGVFERVHVDFDETVDPPKFRAYVVFNEGGYQTFRTMWKKYFEYFGTKINTLGTLGSDAKLQFRYQGNIVARCVGDLKKRETTCIVENDVKL